VLNIHFVENDQTDDNIVQFICERFARLNPDRNEIFQIFEILVDREPHFQNPENISQFRNGRLDPVLNNRRNQQQQVVEVQQDNMTAVQQFVDDPFKGNINPGTSEGAKLYLKATASISEDDKFEINITSAQKFVDMVTKDANNFGWGALLRAIPSDDAGGTKNLLIDHRDITLEMIQKQAYKTWGNYLADFDTPVPDDQTLQGLDPGANQAQREPLFRRVRSRMIAKRIIG